MILGKKVLGIIPARGGSKGVPRKNARVAAGKPLIAWTIEEAKKSKYLDRLILSSDDAEIIQIAREWGAEVPFVRPGELARDDTPGVEPVLHAVRELPGFDYIVLLQPTSPMRTANDIDQSLESCLTLRAPACVSVTVSEKSPYWMYTLSADKHMMPLLAAGSYARRQDIPAVYVLNGAIYIAEIKWLEQTRTFVTEETVAFEMPKEHSVDIDTWSDLVFFEYIKAKDKKVES